jgi:hypothetical protein
MPESSFLDGELLEDSLPSKQKKLVEAMMMA